MPKNLFLEYLAKTAEISRHSLKNEVIIMS